MLSTGIECRVSHGRNCVQVGTNYDTTHNESLAPHPSSHQSRQDDHFGILWSATSDLLIRLTLDPTTMPLLNYTHSIKCTKGHPVHGPSTLIANNGPIEPRQSPVGCPVDPSSSCESMSMSEHSPEERLRSTDG